MIVDRKIVMLKVNNEGGYGKFVVYTKDVRVKGNKMCVKAYIKKIRRVV